MKVKKIIVADVYRDGGSLFFKFEADDGKCYEFFIRTRRFEKNADTAFKPPVIFLERRGGKVMQELSWKEAMKFIASLSFNDGCFQRLVEVVKRNGKVT